MRRATALCLAGLLALSFAATAAAFTPAHGHYKGEDYHGGLVKLHYTGTHVVNFDLEDRGVVVSSVPVNGTTFHGSQNGFEIYGQWQSPTYIKGNWQHRGHIFHFHIYWTHG
jgi:hypothetical protein